MLTTDSEVVVKALPLLKHRRTVTFPVEQFPCPVCGGQSPMRDTCYLCSGHGDLIAFLRAIGFTQDDLVDLHTFCDTRWRRSVLKGQLNDRIIGAATWSLWPGGNLNPFAVHYCLHLYQGWIEPHEDNLAIVRLGLRYVVWRALSFGFDEDDGPFDACVTAWEPLSTAPFASLKEARAFVARL